MCAGATGVSHEVHGSGMQDGGTIRPQKISPPTEHHDDSPRVHAHGQPHVVRARPPLGIPGVTHVYISRRLGPRDRQLECVLRAVRVVRLGRDVSPAAPSTGERGRPEHLVGVRPPPGLCGYDEIVDSRDFEETRGFVGTLGWMGRDGLDGRTFTRTRERDLSGLHATTLAYL